jgi:hypothetical protein
MNIPPSFKVDKLDREEMGRWLLHNNLFNHVSYVWIEKILTFEREEDAVAFSLTFGIQRFETKIEEMIRNEGY